MPPGMAGSLGVALAKAGLDCSGVPLPTSSPGGQQKTAGLDGSHSGAPSSVGCIGKPRSAHVRFCQVSCVCVYSLGTTLTVSQGQSEASCFKCQ